MGKYRLFWQIACLLLCSPAFAQVQDSLPASTRDSLPAPPRDSVVVDLQPVLVSSEGLESALVVEVSTGR